MSDFDRPSETSASGSAATNSGRADVDMDQYSRTIRPSQGWVAIDWRELYASRELFSTLVTRDIKIRYKQTVLGVAWAVVQPLATMVLFTMIFGRIPGVKPEGIPYQLFVFAGMVPWTFFSTAVSSASISLISQQQLLTKIYFPRIYLPAANAGAYMIDMGVGLIIFFFLMPIYHYTPSVNVIFLPFAIILSFAAVLGCGLTLASMTILYRDLRFIVPFLLQMVMFASPIIYQSSMLSRSVQLIVAVNPMTGIISMFRWCILGLPLDPVSLAISVISTIVILIFGLFFFRKSERFFADLL